MERIRLGLVLRYDKYAIVTELFRNYELYVLELKLRYNLSTYVCLDYLMSRSKISAVAC